MAGKVNHFMLQVIENPDQQYSNVEFPVTDQDKAIRCILDIEETKKAQGQNMKLQIEKVITLGFIDNEWKEHLRKMDDLRTSVQHASIEQKDPLVIYKKESYTLFTGMLSKMSKEVVGFLAKANLPQQTKSRPVQTAQIEASKSAYGNASVNKQDPDQFSGSEGFDEAMANSGQQQQQRQAPPKRKPVVVAPKIGRNDKVEIRNMQTGESKSVKFKAAEPLVKSGVWVIVKQEA
jgi:preprotein translocase subunit SecA